MRVRRATGTELLSPFDPVNCTDSGASPGAWGRAMLRGTSTELRGAIVTGAEAGLVVKFWPLAWNVTCPLYGPGVSGGVCTWPRPLAHRIWAVQVPAIGCSTVV